MERKNIPVAKLGVLNGGQVIETNYQMAHIYAHYMQLIS